MIPIKFNINYHIKIKLTERGEEFLKKKKSYILNYPKDADGYISMQTHEVMNTFGNHMFNGFDVPFETNVFICIPEDDNVSLKTKLSKIIKTHLKTKVDD